MTGDWLAGVTGDVDIRARLSPDRQVQDILCVEAAFARALGDVGAVSSQLARRASDAIEAAEIDPQRLSAKAAKDGMPVPDIVQQLKEILEPDLHVALHAGLTSQDVMDSALMLAVSECLTLFLARLQQVESRLAGVIEKNGHMPLMGRTRMQAALPIRLSHRIEAWRAPLQEHIAALPALRARVLVVQMGGPVGTGESFGTPVGPLRAAFASRLGLAPSAAWHTDRSRIADLGAWLARVSGALGKMGHDIALMAQQGLDEAVLLSGGTSSAMAHKTNPVQAEILVALSRDASVQLGALHLSLEHEQERSGAAWALEWLVLPRLLEATGAGLLRADAVLQTVSFASPR